jgi:hypothetical protein
MCDRGVCVPRLYPPVPWRIEDKQPPGKGDLNHRKWGLTKVGLLVRAVTSCLDRVPLFGAQTPSFGR